ncbi:adhesin [Ursidibacter maritimus]|uniref:Adhesin n=1 Tax=Ursidibacter maritimus TaxID=1331689 RepID=A0A949T210_9PAST|nr:adhesin [Ursidibacter maritimus]KAE9542175.1 adhesin [Ursidibacter maritimus]MBV6524258.1 adhesin [Ursidibacter maritimus]MBV6526525.1 adhesin [Ursidibacter maritimus]MBV6528393.1 adhesin [Ursidibacter maritimus]MBV6530298.1 adhesin [Ursidibacter maritimus]
MTEQQKPNVIRFEQAVENKDYETACNELLSILSQIDSNFGELHHIEFDCPQQLDNMPKEKAIYFCTRMAVAITTLFKDPNLVITLDGAQRFLTLQRWLSIIFAASPYVNADHILQNYNCNPNTENPLDIHIEPTEAAVIKFCILYLPESNVSLNLDSLWVLSPELCASLCFALQSPRFIGTSASFAKRGAILQWFPDKLAQLNNLNRLPANISHDVYMHCSYDIAQNKHIVKKALNQVLRRHLLELNWQDRDVSTIGYRNGKPVMVVLLEHFHSAHSIYRTHSTSMIAAREKFYLIGLGSEAVDEAGRAVFDEFHLLDPSTVIDKLLVLKKVCDENQAAILYMPSIGMDLTTIFASNTRLAPIQAVALGHPATTHSDFIEYVIVEDDYVGAEECFSETLLRLPKDALPYVPSALAPTNVEYRFRENPEVVNIGIAATTMKLNPYFLEALRVIKERANVKVHFHFALGQSSGITHPYVERFIKSHLGDSATAYPHTPYHQYLTILHNCDMMLNPFPFGNTNGIIDMVTLGLVGVCKTGPEVHEHIDEGLFKRLGLPEWLIANTVDEYVDRAIRLAENHQERLELRRHIIDNNGLATLFTGDPRPMGNIFLAKLVEWADSHNLTLNLASPEAESSPAKAKRAVKKTSAEKKESKTTTTKKTVKKATEKKVSPLKEAVKKLKK